MNNQFDETKRVNSNQNVNIEYSIDDENAPQSDVDVAAKIDEPKTKIAEIEVAKTTGATPIIPDEIVDDQTVDDEVVEDKTVGANAVGDDAERAMRVMSRRSFLWSALAIGATYGGVNWIQTRRKVDGLPWPLRQSHEMNTQISQEFFSSTRLAPTFSKTQISAPRINGDIGLTDFSFDAEKWKLKVRGLSSGDELSLSLADIKK